jgi:hypothetical protein
MSDKLMKSMMATYATIQEATTVQDQLDEAASQTLNKSLITKAFASVGFSEADAEKVIVLSPAVMRQALKKMLAGGGMNEFKSVIQGGCKGMGKGKLAILYMLVSDMIGEKVDPAAAVAAKTDVDKEKTAKDVEEEE